MAKKRTTKKTSGKKEIILVASGDLRLSANQVCWPAQKKMELDLKKAIEKAGYKFTRGHKYDTKAKHGFIDSQKMGMDVFSKIDPNAKLIVAEAVWQYSHHLLAGLMSHRGPICTVANWSGQWPGLVGMLNLNGSLTKAGVKYTTLWSEDFSSDDFTKKLDQWLNGKPVRHNKSHVTDLKKIKIPATAKKTGQQLAQKLQHEKAIMGVFDEGCMGMFNAIIPDHLLNRTGVFKERLSQSALYHAAKQVSEREAKQVYQWYKKSGMKFNLGKDHKKDLTEAQILDQCRMYIAAMRIADDFGCDCIGIQYQQGLKDCLPASDLVEGTLNDSVRPPVYSKGAKPRELYAGKPLPHFNEVDECAGLDGLLINIVHQKLRQPIENTLHDVRWADWDASGTTDEYVWVFEISGSVPPSHLIDGWAGAVGERQPAMYFPNGGSTIKGISKPGEIIWSRIYIRDDALHMDMGRGKAIELPLEETERRWQATTPQWPIMHTVLYGVTRDQMMAQHQANHVQLVYANNAQSADKALLTRAAMAEALGIDVHLCGTRKNDQPW